MNEAPNVAATKQTVMLAGPGSVSLAMFLASALILFGAILTGYGLVRFNDPAAFAWAPHLLDRRLGLAGAMALVVACVAAAGAGALAHAGRTGAARVLLGLALVAGATTLAVRVLEYPSTSRQAGFLPRVEAAPVRNAAKVGSVATASALAAPDPAHGRAVFLKTCAACHAPDGSGVKGQGANLRESAFIKGKTDDQLLAFVKVGRQPFDPETKLHLSMPARGGNPALTDQDLFDAIANLRQIQKQVAALAAAPPSAEKNGSKTAAPAVAAQAAPADQPQIVDGELWLPHSILPPANPGPMGSRPATVALQKVGASARAPSNVRRFFSIVLLLNGLHAIYLAFGLVLGALTISTAAGGPSARSSLVLAAAYWVVIGGIGLLLVPALYI
jgi:heme/copper-type cytochrome/quinol oxidase subunit 3